jgi:hypothetical protein
VPACNRTAADCRASSSGIRVLGTTAGAQESRGIKLPVRTGAKGPHPRPTGGAPAPSPPGVPIPLTSRVVRQVLAPSRPGPAIILEPFKHPGRYSKRRLYGRWPRFGAEPAGTASSTVVTWKRGPPPARSPLTRSWISVRLESAALDPFRQVRRVYDLGTLL